MNETLEYIDDYFTGTLPDAERAAFENRISKDEAFAQEVVFYLNARQVVRNELLNEKKNQWSSTAAKTAPAAAPVVQMNKPKLNKSIAIAASLFITIGASLFVVFLSGNSPQKQAGRYVNKNLAQLSATMDGSRDSLQLGIEAYNKEDYGTAEKYFTRIFNNHPENTDALKYSGLVSLQQKDYDKAISRFQSLAGHTELYANPGLFYQAIALLQRNNEGDKERAKVLLQTVVDKKAEGSPEAMEWLKKF